MVLQKAVDNLKGRPMNERKAVASGIAILIAAILFIGWGILFFKRIQNTREQAEPVGRLQANQQISWLGLPNPLLPPHAARRASFPVSLTNRC